MGGLQQDAYVKFVFLTGVTKFAKMSVFSGLNNLTDLTMSNAPSSLLDYIDDEISTYFTPHLVGVSAATKLTDDELLTKIKLWYNDIIFPVRVYQFTILIHLCVC